MGFVSILVYPLSPREVTMSRAAAHWPMSRRLMAAAIRSKAGTPNPASSRKSPSACLQGNLRLGQKQRKAGSLRSICV
jgi:hypothetical protein